MGVFLKERGPAHHFNSGGGGGDGRLFSDLAALAGGGARMEAPGADFWSTLKSKRKKSRLMISLVKEENLTFCLQGRDFLQMMAKKKTKKEVIL